MPARRYELFDQIRNDMDAAGDGPLGRLAMAVLLLDERLREAEKWIDAEDTAAFEARDRGDPE